MSISAGNIMGGSSSSLSALELLADPKKLQGRIDALKQAEESAREQINLAGPASEIVAIRAEIDILKEEAQIVLDDAMNEADEIVESANSVAIEIVRASEESAHETEQEVADNVKQAEARISGIKTHETAVQRQIEVANKRASDLDRMEKSLQQKADELEKRAQGLDGEADQFAKIRELIEPLLR